MPFYSGLPSDCSFDSSFSWGKAVATYGPPSSGTHQGIRSLAVGGLLQKRSGRGTHGSCKRGMNCTGVMLRSPKILRISCCTVEGAGDLCLCPYSFPLFGYIILHEESNISCFNHQKIQFKGRADGGRPVQKLHGHCRGLQAQGDTGSISPRIPQIPRDSQCADVNCCLKEAEAETPVFNVS